METRLQVEATCCPTIPAPRPGRCASAVHAAVASTARGTVRAGRCQRQGWLASAQRQAARAGWASGERAGRAVTLASASWWNCLSKMFCFSVVMTARDRGVALGSGQRAGSWAPGQSRLCARQAGERAHPGLWAARSDRVWRCRWRGVQTARRRGDRRSACSCEVQCTERGSLTLARSGSPSLEKASGFLTGRSCSRLPAELLAVKELAPAELAPAEEPAPAEELELIIALCISQRVRMHHIRLLGRRLARPQERPARCSAHACSPCRPPGYRRALASSRHALRARSPRCGLPPPRRRARCPPPRAAESAAGEGR